MLNRKPLAELKAEPLTYANVIGFMRCPNVYSARYLIRKHRGSQHRRYYNRLEGIMSKAIKECRVAYHGEVNGEGYYSLISPRHYIGQIQQRAAINLFPIGVDLIFAFGKDIETMGKILGDMARTGKDRIAFPANYRPEVLSALDAANLPYVLHEDNNE